MSTRETSRITKSRNIKPSSAKKRSLKSSSNKSSNKYHNSYVPKLHPIFTKNRKKLNNRSFYKLNPALTNTRIDGLYPHHIWSQTVRQWNNSSEEGLTISIKLEELSKKRNQKASAKSEKELSKMLSKAHKDYKHVIRGLFKPYLDIISVLDIILLYNGPHLLPIRYSVDLLPYLHSTVRQKPGRELLWTNANKNKTTGECSVDFEPKTDMIVVEDIYDEWVSYIKSKLDLKTMYEEEAMFYIPSGDMFMGIRNHQQNAIHTKQVFTRMYIEALSNFEGCKEYAFRMDLAGINYRYYCRKRRYSPVSWGSRSRCWDGDGMVLLSDGTKKLVCELNVGDEVAVLDSLPYDVSTGCRTATVKVKIESVVNRKYEMVLVNEKLWITPYHAVLNSANEWKMPCHLSKIEERFEASIFNFILDRGHVLCVNDVWACTLGHDLRGEVIENPIWGSSQVMHDMWSKMAGFPNVIEYV